MKYTFFFTWELGDEYGHLARLRPVARALQRRGHRVVIAARDLSRVEVLPEEIVVLPTPRLKPTAQPIREPATFADILFNTGACEAGALAAAVRAWRGLFELVQPDVVIQDFSPLVQLALQGLGIPAALLGSGFACPPALSPLPDLRAWQDHYPERLQMTEDAALAALNAQLQAQGRPPLASVGELFERADCNWLTTFAELDHYPQRAECEGAYDYVGVWSDLGGVQPEWPAAPGRRIFAYLKPSAYLSPTLDTLARSGLPTLVFISGEADTRRWDAVPSLRFSPHPLDMARVVESAEFAILHAGLGATATLLLAGIPLYQLPISVEQYHNALNTKALGAGAMPPIKDPEGVRESLSAAMDDPTLAAGAQRFAARYAGFDSGESLLKVVDKLEALAG